MTRPALVLLATTLFALGAGRASRAEDVPVRELTPEDVALLPLDQVEWLLLVRDHSPLIEEIQDLGRRAERTMAHLARREDSQDAGGRKLAGELARLRERFRPLLDGLREAIRPLGVDEDVLSVLDGAPTGARREERQAVRVVLRVPDLSARARALHAALGPAVEGALLALEASRRRVAALAVREGWPAEVRTRSEALLEEQVARTMKRYWRVVDATLDDEQRVALRRRLPTRVAVRGEPIGHLFLLPDLEPAQGARLKALLHRLEQEAAPDQAAIARVDRALGTGDLTGARRRELGREKAEAEARQAELLLGVVAEGREILTARQWRAWLAVPPLLTAAERAGDLKEVLAEVELTPAQAAAVAELGRRFGPAQGRLSQRLAAIEMERASRAMGEESPERTALEVRAYQAYAEGLEAARAAARILFGEVMATEQVIAWVVGAGKPPRPLPEAADHPPPEDR
jgi:hypothetical protein